MASIVTKRIKGGEYLYLVESVRDGTRVVQKTRKYLGKKRPVRREEFESILFSHEERDWVLREHKDELPYQDHARLKRASDAYRAHLRSLDSVSREQERERFLSLFIANSNAIEGSTLTPGETHRYLFEDVSPKHKTKKELHMATNLLAAWEYVEQRSGRLPKQRDVLALHRLVNKGIEDETTLGRYKRVQNYIGDVLTTSFAYVKERMARLFRWIRDAKEMDDFEVAFQSHAQFEIIHPFIDGNGRAGRLLLNWLLLKRKLSPLAIDVRRRGGYLEALDNARKGKLVAICAFCRDEYLRQHAALGAGEEGKM